jgi:uncharacterized iron-regulated membrane protein
MNFLSNGIVLIVSAGLFLICLKLLTRTPLAARAREASPRAYYLIVLALMFLGVLFLVRGARISVTQ